MINFNKILKWLEDYPQIADWIDFNTTPFEVDNLSFNTVSTEREVETYMDGTRLVDLTFALDLICNYDTGTSNTNLGAMQKFQAISDWIEAQNQEENYPDIDGVVEEVKALQLVPTIVVDQGLAKAKYQGQFRIRYMEE